MTEMLSIDTKILVKCFLDKSTKLQREFIIENRGTGGVDHGYICIHNPSTQGWVRTENPPTLLPA